MRGLLLASACALSACALARAGGVPRATTFLYDQPHRRAVATIAPLDAAWVRTLPCGLDDATLPRVVINSHAAYARPLEQLLHSRYSVGFTEFCRIVVVVGGSPPAPPARVGPVTFVHTDVNAHDLTAYTALSDYATHPFIADPAYLYIHDTCLVGPQFVRFLFWMEQHYAQPGAGVDVFMCPTPSANILAFGAGIVERLLGAGFVGRNITKSEAILVEASSNGPQSLGNVTMLQGAGWGVEIDLVDTHDPFDLYGRGAARHMRYFPDFGVYKFVLLGRHGDMQGGVVPNRRRARR